MSKASITYKSVFSLAHSINKSVKHGISHIPKLNIYQELMALIQDVLLLNSNLENSVINPNIFPQDILRINSNVILTTEQNIPTKVVLSAIVQVAYAEDSTYDFSSFNEERQLLAFYIMSLFLSSSDSNLKSAYEIKKLPIALHRYFMTINGNLRETKILVSEFMKFSSTLKLRGTDNLRMGDTFFCPHKFFVVSGSISEVCGRVLGLQNSAKFNVYNRGKWANPGFYKAAGKGEVIVSSPWSDPYWPLL